MGIQNNQISRAALTEKAIVHLDKLAAQIPTRRVGSAGNKLATDYFAGIAAGNNFHVEQTPFNCIDWTTEGVTLSAAGREYPAKASPYTPDCDCTGFLAVVRTISELEAVDLNGKIALLIGEVAKEQLMPKNFKFFNPDDHQKIYTLLEIKKPEAIIAATGQNWELAAALYPFPLIEDGDFDIPSVYMKDIDGEKLAGYSGELTSLMINAKRIPSIGYNVIARKGPGLSKRIVIFAHIDAHIDIIGPNPGALDNAASVVVLMLLTELLNDYDGDLDVELVAMNGEDYYAASGENLWVEQNKERFSDIILGINMDGLGYIEGHTAYSLYDIPDQMAVSIKDVFARYSEFVPGPQWYQSDHGLFMQNGVPSMALTTDRFDVFAREIAHTPKDTVEVVDPDKLVQTAAVLRGIIYELVKN